MRRCTTAISLWAGITHKGAHASTINRILRSGCAIQVVSKRLKLHCTALLTLAPRFAMPLGFGGWVVGSFAATLTVLVGAFLLGTKFAVDLIRERPRNASVYSHLRIAPTMSYWSGSDAKLGGCLGCAVRPLGQNSVFGLRNMVVHCTRRRL